MPTKLLINQCQIIIFLILKSDNIENSRIDLSKYLQIKLKLHLLLLFLPFNLFHIYIEGIVGRIIGEGGQRVCSPSQIIGAGPPLATPMYNDVAWKVPGKIVLRIRTISVIILDVQFLENLQCVEVPPRKSTGLGIFVVFLLTGHR